MKKYLACLVVVLLVAVSCRISYQFNGASVDYSKIKTLYIAEFQNQAERVNPAVAIDFNERIKDVFTRNTKLTLLPNGPADLEIEGEIIRYDIMGFAVKENSYSSQTRLTMSVRMRYRNNVNPNEDKEETFTAYQDFDANLQLSTVENELIEKINKEIIDQIFNATLSNW